MTTRRITFQQVMIIPALTTLGLGSLLYAQNLSLSPVNAEPLGATPHPALVVDGLVGRSSKPAAPKAKPAAAAQPAAQPKITLAAPPGAEPAQAAAPTGPVANNPEFGAVAPAQNEHIKATTKADLVRMARENSGREDPFVALINPDPTLIQPLPIAPEFRPVKVIPQKTLTTPKVKVATRINAQGNREVVIDPPEAGDEPARGPLVIPKWNLAGVLNTGREQMALLELDGSTREAKLGEVLEDGARVVKIESNKVVLMLNGRRFPKAIGGADAQ